MEQHLIAFFIGMSLFQLGLSYFGDDDKAQRRLETALVFVLIAIAWGIYALPIPQ
jgi:hypothetical protein